MPVTQQDDQQQAERRSRPADMHIEVEQRLRDREHVTAITGRIEQRRIDRFEHVAAMHADKPQQLMQNPDRQQSGQLAVAGVVERDRSGRRSRRSRPLG